MIRVIALITFFFLSLSTLEAFAGFWLAGRWFISSRYASLTLGVVKNWLDRGIINSATQTAKIFIQRNGKWILLTLALSQVISEVQNLQAASEYCYVQSGSIRLAWLDYGRLVVQHAGNNPTDFYSVSYPSPCYSGSAYVPALQIYRWVPYRGSYTWTNWAYIPKAGTYTVGQCQVTVTNRNIGSPCGDLSQPPSMDWQNERRQVPVRVFPNVNDFIRPDVISQDPALSWLRDEYQRIAQDTSIPTIPSNALDGMELPSVDWSISPEEALDQASESSGSESESRQEGEGDISIPGLNTDLNIPAKRSFPVELINSIVQSHPLLRVLQGVSLDVGGGGSCVIGSGVFTIDFCNHAWVLNLMGAIIVPIAFLVGLFGWRND
jgi:hypothetical protein